MGEWGSGGVTEDLMHVVKFGLKRKYKSVSSMSTKAKRRQDAMKQKIIV